MTLTFSRDRPPQLDLHLRSVKQNAARLTGPPVVLFRATTAEFAKGYGLCMEQHPDVRFVTEVGDFAAQTRRLIQSTGAEGYFIPFCDDDVLFRDLALVAPSPTEILAERGDVLCVSLRLGMNTLFCYPHRCEQALPPMRPLSPGSKALAWEYQSASLDFSYVASLDGNVFRTADVLHALEGRTWTNPNQLEDALVAGLRPFDVERPLMASYHLSSLVGIPTNRVTVTHQGNRVGEEHPTEPEVLNAAYLGGARLSLSSVDPGRVLAAHCEFPLVWEKRSPGTGKKLRRESRVTS